MLVQTLMVGMVWCLAALHLRQKSPLLFFYVLGGDPAAGSPTATLLRLRPPQRTQIRP